MEKKRFLFSALSGIMASTLLVACNNAAPPQAAPAAPLPNNTVVETPPRPAIDSAAQPAAMSQPVPFVGSPNAGAILRAAESNATPR